MGSTRWAGLLALLLGILAVACGGGEDATTDTQEDAAATEEAAAPAEEEEAAAEDVTLSLWAFGEMGFDELIADFEADHPGVTVEIREGELDAHHDALTTALAGGGDVPDVAAVEAAFMAQFLASPDQFVNLYDHGAADIEDNYLPWRWNQAVTPDGEAVIGLPTDVGGMAIAYRADLFEAAGLPTERDEVSALWPTWPDFLAVGEQYLEATGEPFIDGSRTLFDVVYRQSDETFYAEDGTLIYDTNPQVRYGWDIATEAITTGISANLGNFTPEWNAAMANGDYAVQMAPAWMMGYITGQAPDTEGLWDVASMPEGGGNWGGSQLVIPARSDQPELAYELISHLLSPEGQLQVFEDYGNFPSVPALYEDPAITGFTNAFFSDAPTGEIYSASAVSIEPAYEGPQQRLITRAFGDGLGRVEEGAETPEEAWESSLAAIALDVSA